MNKKNNTCALFVLSLTSIATISLIPTRAASAADAHKHKTAVLPALAGANSTQVASSSVKLSTIPLIPGIGRSNVADADATATTSSDNANAPETTTKTMNVGESEIFEYDKMTTTAVGDPTVADITPLSTSRLLVAAKGVGHTTVFIYDRRGKNTISLTVLPSENTGVLASEIEEEIGIPTVTVRAINDTIFLEGAAPSPAASQLAEAIAKAYSSKVVNLISVGAPVEKSEAERYADLLNENLNTSGITAEAFDDQTIILKGKYARPTGHAPAQEVAIDDDQENDAPKKAVQEEDDPLNVLLKSLPSDLKIINLINFERQQQRQVLVRCKIVDIDRSSTKNLGLQWGTSNFSQTQVGTSESTQITDSFSSQPILFTQSPGGMFANLLGGGGSLTRYQPWAAELNALINENKARVLSQPSLLVLDGNEANMLVGGEFPVPVQQTNGPTTVLFKPFGIRLSVAPVVVSDDTVQLTVTPEVSEIDFSNAVTTTSGTIPGVDIRRATSTLQMKSGQTLVIGGLYSNNYGKTIQKVPFLSSIPVLGEFFKNTSTSKEERELLVMLEAEIITPSSLGAIPPPAGSLENMNIQKPFVPRKEFNQDSPDIQNGPFHTDPEAPKVQVQMPDTQESGPTQ